jgi:hypothetical protein
MIGSARGLVALALATGCPHGRVQGDGGADDSADDDKRKGDGATAPPEDPRPRCGDGDERARDLQFVPRDAVLAGTVDLRDERLADALVKLRDHVATAGLPVRAAFALGQWHWQVPLLVDTLARRGLVTGELVALSTIDGLGGWVVPLGCTQDEAIATVRAHGAALQDAGTIALVPAVAGETAWDLVIGPGPIATLAAAGRGRELASRLGPGPPPTSPGSPSPAERLAAIESAPVRVVVVAHGFTTSGTLADGSARALRASADAIEDVALQAHP